METSQGNPTSHTRILIVSGVSGSGKTTVLRALEDSGYFCIDNLPGTLVASFLKLCDNNTEIPRAALVMDGRGEPFAEDIEELITGARAAGHALSLLFLDCENEVLIRRFSETRRRHPFCGPEETLLDGIERERTVLRKFRVHASMVLDTSHMNVHQLRRTIVEQFAPPEVGRMPIIITSFGFKYGVPHEAEYVFDGRFLSNPHFMTDLRPLSGLNPGVRDYVLTNPDAQQFLSSIYGLLDFVIPKHDTEGKALLTIAVGCTGGRHRSVCLAEELGEHIREHGWQVSVHHRDIERR